jgi:hypothetical protein
MSWGPDSEEQLAVVGRIINRTSRIEVFHQLESGNLFAIGARLKAKIDHYLRTRLPGSGMKREIKWLANSENKEVTLSITA